MTDQQPEMARLDAMAGEWDVTFEARNSETEPFGSEAVQSSIGWVLGGNFLQERISIPVSPTRWVALIGILGYDRFRSTYRFAWLDDLYGVFDVQEGGWVGDALVVDNLRSQTSFRIGDRDILSRTSWHDIRPEGFRMVSDLTTDGGATWWTQARGSYSRRRA